MGPADSGMSGSSAIAEWETVLGEVLDASDSALTDDPAERTAAMLAIAEAVIVRWLRAHGRTPTEARVEGYRLLALQRQGARRDPTFNACRESCRELIYQCNMARAYPAEAARRLRLAAMVCRHLALFVFGKLETAALGEFCCASRPLRAAGTT